MINVLFCFVLKYTDEKQSLFCAGNFNPLILQKKESNRTSVFR